MNSASKIMLEIERWISDPAASNHLTSHASVVRSVASQIFSQQKIVDRNFAQKPTVAIYGASQSGKSYLTAKMCEKHDGTVSIKIDKDYDFLREINPPGGRESTALITRMTANQDENIKNSKHVYASLLSLADLVAIFANIHASDLKNSNVISREVVSQRIENVCGCSVLDDIHKAKEWVDPELIHLQRLLGYLPLDLRPFTDMFRLPKGSLESKNAKALKHLFSPLWGDIEELGELFQHLCEYLLQINRSPFVWIPVEAFVPRENSIIDVSTLAQLLKTESYDSQIISVISSDETRLELPRPILCALISEVQFRLNSPRNVLLKSVDLLDFPGARSRIRREINQYDEIGIDKLFLRGKISHLFESAASRDEVDTLLLCVKPGPMDIAALPDSINRWVGGVAEHQVNSRLFILATQFDLHFPDAAGQSKQERERFDNVVFSALIEPFAPTEESWVQKFNFKNVFPIRNPNYPYDGFFEYDKNGKEVSLREDKADRILELQHAFTDSSNVIRYIEHSTEKWNSLMTPGDGGAFYLMRVLNEVDWIKFKKERLEERQNELLNQAHSLLEPFVVYGDASKKIEIEKEKFLNHFAILERLVQSEMLASFVELFSISPVDLNASVRSHLVSEVDEPEAAVRVSGVRVPKFLEGKVTGHAVVSVQSPREKFLHKVISALLVSFLEELENNIKNCPRNLTHCHDSMVYLNSHFTDAYQLVKLKEQLFELGLRWSSGLKLTDHLEPLCILACRIFDTHFSGPQGHRALREEAVLANPVTHLLTLKKASPGNIDFFNDWMDYIGVIIEENSLNTSSMGRDLTLNNDLLYILEMIKSRIETHIPQVNL